MAKPAGPRDAVSVVIPVYNAADRLEKIVPAWGETLARLDREYDIIVVDDGSTDATPAVLEKLAAGRVRHLRVLRHDARRGFGACLKTALPEVRHPLLFYTSPDYPYTPADVRRLFERVEVRDEVLGKYPDLISGCRTGKPVPPAVRWFGRAWRLFWRVTVGLHMQPSLTWLGTREFLYGCLVGWVFGVPLADVNSAFKLYRTAFLKRIRIQSDGDFVHAELVAKATFLTSIMDELPLTPAPSAGLPAAPSVWKEMGLVFRDPDFGSPPTPPAPTPGEPGGVSPPGNMPVEGSRALDGDAPPAPPAVPNPPPDPPPASLSFAPAV